MDYPKKKNLVSLWELKLFASRINKTDRVLLAAQMRKDRGFLNFPLVYLDFRKGIGIFEGSV